MKLAMVLHNQHDDTINKTLLMVPDELARQDLSTAANRAHERYMADAVAWLKNEKEPTPVGLDSYSLHRFPKDTTIGEIIEKRAKYENDYLEWRTRRNNALRSFSSYLQEEITGSHFLDDAVDLEVMVYWGNQHGALVNSKEPEDRDVRGAVVNAEGKS